MALAGVKRGLLLREGLFSILTARQYHAHHTSLDNSKKTIIDIVGK